MSEREVNQLLKTVLRWAAGITASIAVILIAQTGALIYWCGTMNEAVGTLKRDVSRHENSITTLQAQIYNRSASKD